jgi:hypothetical protein
MWDLVDEQTGYRREENFRIHCWELLRNFEPQVARFCNTHESAWEIVRQCVVGSESTLLDHQLISHHYTPIHPFSDDDIIIA